MTCCRQLSTIKVLIVLHERDCTHFQRSLRMHICRRLFLLVRGIFGFGAIGNYLFAVTMLPLNDTLVLTFTAPIWASVLGPFIIVKESASK